MIQKPTALILGAGSNMNYRFPSAAGVLDAVVQALGSDSVPAAVLDDLGFEKHLCDALREDLTFSGCSSVDAFLEHRPEFVAVGKAAIAAVMIPFETPANLFDEHARSRGCYQYLFNLMRCPLQGFGRNQLRVITFNYDRSFEFYFLRALQASYGIGEEEAWGVLKQIRIIHVHGALGALDPFDQARRPYEPTVTPEAVRLAAANIVVVSETDADSDELSYARAELDDAERIFFIGFGYHQENLRKLRMAEMIQGKEVLGSSHGMEVVERNRISRDWGIKLEQSGVDALLFLRRMVDLTDGSNGT